MIDVSQLRRLNRERVRRGMRELSRADVIQRNSWLALYRDGDKETRRRALAALDGMNRRGT